MTRETAGPRFGAASSAALPVDFAAFHQMHRRAYIAWAGTYLNNRADAEEAVDWAFEQLLVAWPEVLSKENPAAYAWRVMKHRTVDTGRACGRRAALVESAFRTAAVREAVDPIGRLEESLSLWQAIAALPDRQQDVMVLRYGHGYSAAEVAEHMGITPAGVRSTARHAKRRLRAALGLDEEGHADDVAH